MHSIISYIYIYPRYLLYFIKPPLALSFLSMRGPAGALMARAREDNLESLRDVAYRLTVRLGTESAVSYGDSALSLATQVGCLLFCSILLVSLIVYQ